MTFKGCLPLSHDARMKAEGSNFVEEEVGDDDVTNEELRLHTVGEQLKAERERQKLSLNDVATRTRIPIRHLESIEQSQYAALPGTTYSIGFTRSYAKLLKLDSEKLCQQLRTEMAEHGHESYFTPTQNYEPADPSRVPPGLFAWTALAIAILMVAVYVIWRSYSIENGEEIAAPPTTELSLRSARKPAVPAKAPDQDGEVILTAIDNVWVKIYDADNKPLYENEMKPGDQYHVPADANNPMIVTGRPQSIKVTVGGAAVPPLGPADRTIADVPVSARSLIARPTPPPAEKQVRASAERTGENRAVTNAATQPARTGSGANPAAPLQMDGDESASTEASSTQ